jgi:hypothetical protein
MLFQDGEPGLKGQELVFNAWRRRLHGRDFIARDDLDFPAIISELAHVSVLACEAGGCFRFRLAGTGLRAVFGCEAKGMAAAEIDACRGATEWTELAAKSLARCAPVAGRTRLDNGMVHYWLRLPMSSDGVMADQVLCHDRFLPAEAIADPDRAAREADKALRLDAIELVAA